MYNNPPKLNEIIGYVSRGEDIPEMHLRWAVRYFDFEWTPTQQELKAKLVELGHISE